MKKTVLLSCAAALLFASCNNTGNQNGGSKSDTAMAVITSDSQPEEAWVPVDSATQMKMWMEYATPGDMHKMMASWAGTWDADMTSWDYEGATPHASKGSAVYTMILGGRYLSGVHTANMMGMPFEGHDLMGYDNATKMFVSTWVDNFGTGITSLSGTYDAGSKTLTISGKCPDVCRPGKEYEMKEVITVVDNDHHKMEMYCPDPKTGKMFKMMEINSTRKK